MPKPTLNAKVTITNKESFLFDKCGIIISINIENGTYEVAFSPEDYQYFTVDQSCSEEFRIDEMRVHKSIKKIQPKKQPEAVLHGVFSF